MGLQGREGALGDKEERLKVRVLAGDLLARVAVRAPRPREAHIKLRAASRQHDLGCEIQGGGPCIKYNKIHVLRAKTRVLIVL